MIPHELEKKIRNCQRAVIFTGAGVSAESGIPTFRDTESGLWAKFDPREVACIEAYRDKPQFVWNWYAERAGSVRNAVPNAAHQAITRLQTLLPEVTVVTQNIDCLHQKAGSRSVLELHGSLFRLKAFVDPETIPDPNVVQVICHVCDGYAVYENCDPYASKEDLALLDLVPGPVPRCPGCGSLLRPDIVWFGEPLDVFVLDRAMELADTCDLMICIGSSLEVQPAASIPFRAQLGKAVVIEINPEPTDLSAEADAFLQGRASEVLPSLVDYIWRP